MTRTRFQYYQLWLLAWYYLACEVLVGRSATVNVAAFSTWRLDISTNAGSVIHAGQVADLSYNNVGTNMKAKKRIGMVSASDSGASKENIQPDNHWTDNHETAHVVSSRRRRDLAMTAISTLVATAAAGTTAFVEPARAVQAVGSGELACRAAGNCLETGEWDGAIGWTWGGKDRCDASDPTCGANGKRLVTLDADGNVVGKAVPTGTDPSIITQVAALRIDVGRGSSGEDNPANTLRLGLYGGSNDALTVALVQQMVDFLSKEKGLSTLSSSAIDNTIGKETAPVMLSRGGAATWVTPETSIEFGVPSQSLAYARVRGSSKVLDAFIPQPRPPSIGTEDSKSTTTPLLSHNAPGLVSVSKNGLGYGGTGFESDDECFERAFLITNAAAPSLDKTRQVIGQVLDGSSMAFLERLTNLPTNRGIRGVLPGQNDGPPLSKVIVRDVAVASVVNRPSTTESS